MAIITDEQRILLERDARFQDVSRQAVKNFGIFMVGVDDPASLSQGTPKEWATQRLISAGVVQHPNNQDYNEWITQFSMFLKGQNVWQTDVASTIDAMIASGKFDELAALTYRLRAQKIEF